MKEVMLSAEPSETVREDVRCNLPVGFALVREARVVAVGVSFPTAGAVVQWLGDHRSTVVWPDLTDAMVVHGHEGTELIWDDRAWAPTQDAHTPREQPQTRSGGTESGEGGGGALRVFFGGDDERRMWTWECLDGHASEFGDEPTETEACDALARHRAEEHGSAAFQGTTPEQAYGRKGLQREVEALRAQTARDRADLDAAHTMQQKREAEIDRLRAAHKADVENLGQANVALVAQIDRVRALAEEWKERARAARAEASDADTIGAQHDAGQRAKTLDIAADTLLEVLNPATPDRK